MKKALSLLLAFTAILSVAAVAPVTAGAAEADTEEAAVYVTESEENAVENEESGFLTQKDTDYNSVGAGEDAQQDDASAEKGVKPAAPVISLANTAAGLKASWNAVNDVRSYVVFYRTDPNEEWISFETGETSALIPEAISGTLYYVKVQSIGDVSGDYSKVKSMTCIDRAALTDASYNGSSVLLAWNGVNGANKFQIARLKAGESSFRYFTPTATSFSDNGVAAANTYYYQVRAMYVTAKNGTAYGAWSPVKSAVTITKPNVSLSNKYNGIRAEWKASGGASKYIVYFKTASAAKWSSATTANTYYPILNTVSGTLYYVQIRPVSGSVNGPYSKVKSMTFIARPDVTLSNAADGIKASWKAVGGENRYQIAKKKKGDSAYTYYLTDGSSYLDKDVSNNTEYLYKVRAMYETEKNGTAYGAWSTETSARRINPPEVVLSNKSNGIRAEWKSVGGASKYIIYFKTASAAKWSSATTTDTYYLIPNTASGTLYYVQVRPAAGNYNGAYSKVNSITFIGGVNPQVSVSGSDLKFSWSSVKGANKYEIAKKKKGDYPFEYFTAAGTSFSDKIISGSKDIYSYQIRAVCENGDGSLSGGVWSGVFSFLDGKLLNGYVTIDGKKYYYKNGTLQKNGIVGTVSEGLSYADSNGVINGSFTGIAQDKDSYWYLKNGKIDLNAHKTLSYNGKNWNVIDGRAKQVKTESDKTLSRALQLLSKITTEDMTKEKKLKTCFDYIKKAYTELNPRIPHYTGSDWPIIYANDMFIDGAGNCFSYAACFCYLAKAIGYNNVYACTSGGHAWAEIEGKIYDPEWSRHRFGYTYYGMSYNDKCDVDYKGGISAGASWMHMEIKF